MENNNWVTLKVSDGTQMRAYTAGAASGKRGIIVLQEVFGVNAHIRDVADRFAKEGYLVVAPELFHRTAEPGFECAYDNYEANKPHREALTNEGIVADVEACRNYLIDAGCEKVGVVGFCLGGRSAYLSAASMPLHCAISFYGGGIAPTLLDKAQDISCPILMFWGGLDKNIPPEQRRAVDDALAAAGKQYTDVVFGSASHAFFRDVWPASYHTESAAEAWPLALHFLKQHLG